MREFFHRLAARELAEARRRYAGFGPPTGTRFFQTVLLAVDRIEANPNAGSPFRGSFRWVRTPKGS